MSTVQRIARNTAVVILGDVTSKVIAFFYFVYLARYLGVEDLGVISFAIAFAYMFSLLVDLGLASLVVREIARDRSQLSKYLNNITAIRIVLAPITFGLVALTINLLHYPRQTVEVVYLFALVTTLDIFSLTFYSIFQAFERLEFRSAAILMQSILLLAGVLFLIKHEGNLISFSYLYLATSAFTLLFCFIISIWKFTTPKIELDWLFCKQTIKQALPFMLIATFANIYYRFDSVMLSLMQNDQAVGWYNAAYRVYFILPFIPNAFFMATYPVMSRLYVSSQESLRFAYERSLKYIVILCFPICLGITLLSKTIISLIFGTTFAPSVPAAQILVWSFLLASIFGVLGNLLVSINRQATHAKVVGMGLLINVSLNLLLIPGYSFIGASIASDIARFLAVLVGFVVISKTPYRLSVRVQLRNMVKLIIANLTMGIFVVCLNPSTIPTLIGVVAAAAVIYFLVLYLMKSIDQQDISLVKRLLGRRAK